MNTAIPQNLCPEPSSPALCMAGSFSRINSNVISSQRLPLTPKQNVIPYPSLQAILQPITYFITFCPIWKGIYSSLSSPLGCKLLTGKDMCSLFTAEAQGPKQWMAHSRIWRNTCWVNEPTLLCAPDLLNHILWEQCLESAFFTSASDDLYTPWCLRKITLFLPA